MSPTLDRDEIAVRMACALIARDGYDDEGAPRDAVTLADALLAALTLTPAPVAPPAGKYEPRVGDVVRFVVYGQTNGDGVVVAIQREGVASIRLFGESVHALTWGRYFRDLAYLRPATPSELAAAGLAVPPPATAGEGPASIARRAIESVVTGWDATMIDEAVARVVGATPAPEAKRPEWVRYVKSGSDAVIARPVLRWEGANPVVPSSDGAKGLDHSYTFHLLPDEWVACDAPAPCPPPVAGSVDPVREAERAVVKAAEALQAADDAYAELYATVKDDDDAHNEARPRLDQLHAARLNRRFDLTDAVRALRTSRPVRP